MSVKLEFYLCEEDADRLFAVKEEQGKTSMTGNEFAKFLLETELHRLHPRQVVNEEDVM